MTRNSVPAWLTSRRNSHLILANTPVTRLVHLVISLLHWRLLMEVSKLEKHQLTLNWQMWGLQRSQKWLSAFRKHLLNDGLFFLWELTLSVAGHSQTDSQVKTENSTGASCVGVSFQGTVPTNLCKNCLCTPPDSGTANQRIPAVWCRQCDKRLTIA